MNAIGAICCVHDDDAWLKIMVEGCYDAVDHIFFLVGAKAWSGVPGDNASTLAAIQSCEDPHKKIALVHGEWKTEADQRNAGLDVCADAGCEWCCVIDADEIYDPAVLRRMIATVRASSEIDTWTVSFVTYWKSYLYKIDPLEPCSATAIVRVGRCRFTKKRNTDSSRVARICPEFATFHHLSYVRTDNQMRRKIAHYSHAHQILPGWFTDVWQRWQEHPEMENLHPMWPRVCRRAIPQNPSQYPPALKRLYDRETARVPGASELLSS